MCLTIMSQAQTTFTLVQNCKQTVKSGDTAILTAMLTASDGFGSLSFIQASGPSVSVLGTPLASWQTGLQAVYQVPVTKLVPGLYVYTITGKSAKGTVGTTLDSLVVVAPPPPPPPVIPRTVIGFTLTLVNGVWVPTWSFSDKTTQ